MRAIDQTVLAMERGVQLLQTWELQATALSSLSCIHSIPFHSIPFQQSHSDLSSSFKFYRDLWWSLCQQWGLTLEPPQHSPKPEVDLISSTLERLSHGKTYFRGNCDSFLFSKKIKKHTLWLFNIAMENGPFIDDFPSYKPPFIGDSPWLCES